MRMQRSIFLWVSFGTLVPLTLLVLGATLYSQRLFEKEVGREIMVDLETIVAEIDRRLIFDRSMLQGLVDTPVVQKYLPVLQFASSDRIHKDYFQRSHELNRFLEEFQDIVSGLDTIRLLDIKGNTLVMVRNGSARPQLFDGIESFPFAEEELDDEELFHRMRELPPNDVGVVLLTQSRREFDDELPMMDYIIPMTMPGEKEVIGYLTANIRGEQIDRILSLATRQLKGELLIAEYNPELPERHGMLLYDEASGLKFSDVKLINRNLKEYYNEKLWAAVRGEEEGVFTDAQSRETVYFLEYLPYPNLLANWVVAMQVDQGAIAAPFERIRLAIGLFATAALLLSLWFASISARQISRPVMHLVHSLKSYARGNYQVRVDPKGNDEIIQLGQAFNDMADSLDHARVVRDRAEKLMLQSDKLASIGQLAAGIGHELNNPLGNILSYSKLLERELGDNNKQALQDLKSIREEALRASQIIKGVLNFARQVPPSMTCFELRSWLHETLSLVAQVARDRGVELNCTMQDEMMVEGDRAQLQQALVNLLLNAIQASQTGDSVTVSASTSGGSYIIEVHDQASGMDDSTLQKVFDPFFSTKSEGEGTGLGLSISLGIVERHDGELTLFNNDTGGITARMLLPLEQNDG